MSEESTTSPKLVDSTDDDDAVAGVGVLDMPHTMEKMLISVGYPALRLVLALAVVWIASSASS